MKYRIMVMDGDEYLVIRPYLTEWGNILGIVVICVTNMLDEHRSES